MIKRRFVLVSLMLVLFSSLAFPQDKPAVSGLEILKDRVKWNKASKKEQDAAITVVAKKLGSAYSLVTTKEYSCGGQKHRLATFKHVKSGALMNLIPAGKYTMGGSGDRDGKPAHKATIEKPFLIGIYEVRQSVWDKIGGDDDRKWKGGGLPIENCSWNDVTAWLKKAGGGLRLPSEAEWEYACRAGSQTTYFWGDDMDPSFCWFRGNSGYKSHTVTEHSTKTNSFGLVDMLGNVYEWCQDGWVDNYNSGPSNQLPRNAIAPSKRVLRGGGWGNVADYVRSAYRGSNSPGLPDYGIGFRVVRGIDP